MRSLYKIWQEKGELENILTLIKKWRSEGTKIEDIALKLNINPNTLYVYQKKYPEFDEALKISKEIQLGKVTGSLIKECVGYYYDEERTTTSAIVDKTTGKITNFERVEKIKFRKYARPQVGAIIFYLGNADPKQWQNKLNISEEDNGIIDSLTEALKELKGDRATQNRQNANAETAEVSYSE